VFALFEEHIGRLKELLGEVVSGLPSLDGTDPGGRARTRPCGCADWLADVTLPFELPGPV
jgi:5'-methylthioadenosine phosphorylase